MDTRCYSLRERSVVELKCFEFKTGHMQRTLSLWSPAPGSMTAASSDQGQSGNSQATHTLHSSKRPGSSTYLFCAFKCISYILYFDAYIYIFFFYVFTTHRIRCLGCSSLTQVTGWTVNSIPPLRGELLNSFLLLII